MIRPIAVLGLLLLGGCGRPTAPSERDSASTLDNALAPRSIIQPEVAAENPPEPEPTPAPAEPAVRNATVPFARGVLLDDPARAVLDPLLATLPAGATIVLRGHSDSSGSDGSNLAASRKRAEVVRDYLVAHGIDAKRIAVVAIGERRPIAPNAHLDGSDDPDGRARNRRVDIEIVPMAPPPTPAAAPTASAPAT